MTAIITARNPWDGELLEVFGKPVKRPVLNQRGEESGIEQDEPVRAELPDNSMELLKILERCGRCVVAKTELAERSGVTFEIEFQNDYD